MTSVWIVRRVKSSAKVFLIVAIWPLVCASLGFGQNVSAQVADALPKPAIAFDVVSVRQNTTGHPTSVHEPPDGEGNGITITSMPLRSIIAMAFDVQSDDLLAATPDWVNSERYDIEAKMDDANLDAYHKLNRTQRMMMLRQVLADRFKMQVHRVPKEVSIYALVVAKNGLKIKEVKPGEVRSAGIKGRDGAIVQGPMLISMARGQMLAQEMPLGTFAKALSGLAGWQVVDKTGVAGVYDFTLQWDPDQANRSPDRETAAPPADVSRPSIFSALEEQLGLKLESQKVMMPVIVVDHIEHPSAN